MATTPDLQEPQIAAARAQAWHQNGEPLLTLEAARNFLNEHGLLLFGPRGATLGAPAPSLVEATLGTAKATITPADAETARGLVARLVGEGSALPLNLLGGPGDLPDFIVSASAFPFVFTLRGDKGWKRPPETSGAVKVTPLALRAYELLSERGAMTIAHLVPEIGREVTDSAIGRSLNELWSLLRVIPVLQQGGGETLWELTTARFVKAVKAGANAGQPTSLSALVSLYLGQVYIATEEEIAGFLSPLTARSRVRDVLHGLVAGRQLNEAVLDGKAVHYIPDALPDFAQFAEPVPEPEASSDEAALGVADSTEATTGEGRIRRFDAGSGERARGTGLRGKPVRRSEGAPSRARTGPDRAGAGERRPRPSGDRPSRGPADRAARGPSDRPKRSFSDRPARTFGDRDTRPKPRPRGPDDRPADAGRPSYARPWDEDRQSRPPRAAQGGEDRPQRPGRPPRAGAKATGDRPERRPATGRPPRREGAGGERPPFRRDRPEGDRPAFRRDRPEGDRPAFRRDRPAGDRPAFRRDRPEGDRPAFRRARPDKPAFGGRREPGGEDRPAARRRPFPPELQHSPRPEEGGGRPPRESRDDRPARPRTGPPFGARAGRDRPGTGGGFDRPRGQRDSASGSPRPGGPVRPVGRGPQGGSGSRGSAGGGRGFTDRPARSGAGSQGRSGDRQGPRPGGSGTKGPGGFARGPKPGAKRAGGSKGASRGRPAPRRPKE